MIIAVASGKGGTGKTTIAVNVALALEHKYNVQFFDCDVEAPNAYLFLKPRFTHSEPVKAAGPTVTAPAARFAENALKCALFTRSRSQKIVCSYFLNFATTRWVRPFCPENAIGKKHNIGHVESGNAGNIAFFQGSLTPGEALSPPIIQALKRKMNRDSIVIVDAPPGTSCPVVDAIKGSDVCLLVTEPTPFGLHDLTLAVELVSKLELPAGVIINQADIGDDKVEAYCKREGLPILMRLPYDQELAINYAQGIPAIEALPEYRERFSQLCQNIKTLRE